jgi:hypothetical protein
VTEELRRDITAQITPPVEVTFEAVVSDGKPVTILTVPDGSRKPHAIEPGGIFVRRDTGTAQATRDEIVQMVTGAAPPALAAPSAAPTNGRASLAPNRAESPVSRRRSPRTPPSEAGKPSPVVQTDSTMVTAPPPSTPLPVAALDTYEESVKPDPVTPTTGIEVLDAFDQDGARYYTLRDLRYHKLIHNVTKATDRRLWRAAIAQREKGDLDDAVVQWDGDYGLWRSYPQRSGDRRFDLVYRGDGDPRVFFGVSQAGMTGRWKNLIPAPKATV